MWRTDISTFVDGTLVEELIDRGVRERPHDPAIHNYIAFADETGGGGGDASTLAIVHQDRDRRVVQDLMRIWRPPFDTAAVIAEKAALLRSYRLASVTMDHWAGGLPPSIYSTHGIQTHPAEPKSKLYLDFLGILNSRRLLILDEPTQIAELCNLERRVAWGGRESIDHPQGGNSHDDAINSLAGAAVLAATEAAPALWHSSALLAGGAPTPWPVRADVVFATAAADERGVFWCLWARDANFGGPPLALFDYGRAPFSADLFVTLARRLVAEGAASHARGHALYAPAVLAAQATEILMTAALAAIAAGGSAADINIAVEPGADDLLADREALLLAAAVAIGAGKVKLAAPAAERSLTLPSPLATIHPGAAADAETDAALAGIGLALLKPPNRPATRMGSGKNAGLAAAR